ncbi:MAG: amino acid racemase [Caldimonas sp.]
MNRQLGPVGVIGGMGPRATVDFLDKVVDESAAAADEDHVPMLISCDPRIPRRPEAILQDGESPLPVLLEIRDRLLGAGVSALVMPCNTAHRWYAELTTGCPVPFLSIVQAGCDEVRRLAPAGATVAVLSTRATQAAKLFDTPLAREGFRVIEPTDAEQDRWVLPAIAAVKAGRSTQAGPWLDAVLQALAERGAAKVLLACTELPVVLSVAPSARAGMCIDTTRALARATVVHWRACEAAAAVP